MNGDFAPRWICPQPFWHRHRALQVPAAPGLFALACGEGAWLAVRRRMAVVKSSYGKKNEGTAQRNGAGGLMAAPSKASAELKF
jgi:hypothetical protein